MSCRLVLCSSVRPLARRALVVLLGWGWLSAGTPPAAADDAAPLPPYRVSTRGTFPPDGRLGPPRKLGDAYHPWTPPATLADWDAARERIQTQLLVACGLWPLPEKQPLEPVVHGLVDRDDYTVERVFFASRPGLYVTGSLYRPKGGTGRRPGVLCPHGHWATGRFYDAGDKEAARQIEIGAESLPNAAHSPLQARMVQLARMGCVVFHYDMIGYADQGPLDHRHGFDDPEAELRSQNLFGLQTWNSLRALDFLASLPDVDPQRIAVTGASGGGTQTFILCALDPRPAVAFPAVMVSTNMQGGCVCENASYLRLGLNNVAFAACFAPRPLGMSGADDWTIAIETKGLPELKQIWGLYGQPDLVAAKCFPQFGHNYNQVSRTLMYEWLNRHLGLGATEPIVERDFTPLTREEMTVFTADHPRPGDALTPPLLRERLTQEQLAWYADLLQRAKVDAAAYERVVRPAAEILFGPLPNASTIQMEQTREGASGEYRTTLGTCGREADGSSIPWVLIWPKEPPKGLSVYVDGRGKQALFDAAGKPIPPVEKLLKDGEAVLTADVFLTGEYLPMELKVEPPVNRGFAGYTFGYNRPLLAERVRDLLTVATAGEQLAGMRTTRWIGTREAGPWVLLARALRGPEACQTLVDLGGFTFGGLSSTRDPNFLPAALKFGGLGGLLALAGAVEVEIAGMTPQVEQELAPFVELGGKIKVRQQSLQPARED